MIDLSYGIGLPVSSNKALSATTITTLYPPGAVYAVSSPTLPRDFVLPTPLFALSSAWNQTATGAAVWPDSDQQILVTYRVLL